MQYDHDADRAVTETASTGRGGVAAGKRTLTEAMPAPRPGGAALDAPPAPPPAASAGSGGDDPFGMHLLGAVQRKDTGADARGDAAGLVAAAASGTGAPLPGATRDKFEASLGADLGGVRVHDGAASATAADALAARAYTTGQDIHFGAGELDPASPAGEQLLAHEVAHTVQQGARPAAPQTKLAVSSPGDASEREADVAADAMVSGRPAAVTSSGAAPIAREPKKDKPEPPPTKNTVPVDTSTLEVTAGQPKFAGAVTAEKDGGKVRLISPLITFDAVVKATQPLGDGERIDVGPVQTMLSASRVGVYREGGRKDGPIVAEQHTDLGQMRDVEGEIDKHAQLDQKTVAPFYAPPSPLNASTDQVDVKFQDKPKALFPATVGKGKLTETKGQDSFVTSVAAQHNGNLVHLRTFKWQLPWGLQLDDGVIQADPAGKSTAQGISEQAAQPSDGIAINTNDPNQIPILAAKGATHMDFTSLDAAMACGVKELLSYLPTSGANPTSQGFLVQALKAKNPMFHITVTVDKKNSSWGKDSVETRIKGQAQVSRPRVSAGDGDPVAVMASFNELFTDPAKMNGSSFVMIEAQDKSLIDGKSHRVDWPIPFDEIKGKMNGSDGEYSIVANMR